MTGGAKWKGVDEAVEAIRGLGEIAAPVVIGAALLAVGRPMAEEMRALTPRRSNLTADDIQAALVHDADAGTVRLDIGARGGKKGRAFILRFLEFGTFYQKKTPILRPVWDAHRPRFAEEFLAALEPVYTRIVKALARRARSARKKGPA